MFHLVVTIGAGEPRQPDYVVSPDELLIEDGLASLSLHWHALIVVTLALMTVVIRMHLEYLKGDLTDFIPHLVLEDRVKGLEIIKGHHILLLILWLTLLVHFIIGSVYYGATEHLVDPVRYGAWDVCP